MDSDLTPPPLFPADGGDLRVVSEMIILANIMRRIAWDRKKNTVLPCKYFHVIAGVGAGGYVEEALSTHS